jgi:hypothetical protein
MKEFPSLKDVSEILESLNKLFEDRNHLLNLMFREDKYKDFLLSESVQSLAEADARDDSKNGRIKTDLAGGFEVLKASTKMQKFSNFINPQSLPALDLENPLEFMEGGDDRDVEPEDVVKDEGSQTGVQPPKDTGNVNITPPAGSPRNPITQPGASQQTPGFSQGGVISPAVQKMMSPGKSPVTAAEGVSEGKKSSSESLEDAGLVGKKHPAAKMQEMLGLDQYKKAMAGAMALPLKAMAAGLSSLLGKIGIPGVPAFDDIVKNAANVAKAFGIPQATMKKIPGISAVFGGAKSLVSNVGNFFGGMFGDKKSPVTSADSKSNVGGASGEEAPKSNTGHKGGARASTGRGGPVHGLKSAMSGISAPSMSGATANLATGSTTLNNMSSTLNQTGQMLKQSTSLSSMVSDTSVSNNLSGVTPAQEGSTNLKQDINFLTNSVNSQNESVLISNTASAVSSTTNIMQEGINAMSQMVSAGAKASQKGPIIGTDNPVPSAPLKVSDFLLASISITKGGETHLDIV